MLGLSTPSLGLRPLGTRRNNATAHTGRMNADSRVSVSLMNIRRNSPCCVSRGIIGRRTHLISATANINRPAGPHAAQVFHLIRLNGCISPAHACMHSTSSRLIICSCMTTGFEHQRRGPFQKGPVRKQVNYYSCCRTLGRNLDPMKMYV